MIQSTTHAYLLGSIPRRLYRARARSKVNGDEAFQEVRTLAEQWLALLDAVKDQSIRPSVQQLLDRLALEQEHVEAQNRYRRLLMFHQFARSGNEGVSHPGEPPTAPTPAPDSLALASALVDRTEHAQIRDKLPADLRDLHEMGYLVAECRWGNRDENDAIRIWEIAKRVGCEEWLTGRPSQSPLRSDESLYSVVQKRIDLIDEAFLTRQIPNHTQQMYRGSAESHPNHGFSELKEGIAAIHVATQQIDRKQETLSCDLVRVAETVDCIADDSAGAKPGQEALTVRQCAERANVKVGMIKRAIKKGELLAKPLRARGEGTEYRVLAGDLENWLKSGRNEIASLPQQPALPSTPKPRLPNYLDR